MKKVVDEICAKAGSGGTGNLFTWLHHAVLRQANLRLEYIVKDTRLLENFGYLDRMTKINKKILHNKVELDSTHGSLD